MSFGVVIVLVIEAWDIDSIVSNYEPVCLFVFTDVVERQERRHRCVPDKD